jgi:hypothetical protein
MASDGLSDQQRKIVALRQEFFRKATNPYRHATMEGGHLVRNSTLFNFHYD